MRTILLAVLALALSGAVPAAQAPKIGATYLDDTSLGFSVKTPKDWSFYPPKPGDEHMIGRYEGDRFQASANDQVTEEFYLVKFDGRPGPGGAKPVLRYASIDQFIDGRPLAGSDSWEQVEQRELKVKGLTAVEYVYKGSSEKDGVELGAYAAVFDLGGGLRVALCGNGPGERKWSKYEEIYQRMAKTFQRVEVAAAAPPGPGKSSLRELKRQKLLDEAHRTPGWRLLETPNYFVITNSDDQPFLDELMDRIEAIRAVYEVDYPPSSARPAKQPEPETPPELGKAGEEGEAPTPERTFSPPPAALDPMELSRTSVVRVCATRQDYLGYGAPKNSAGYWSPSQQELVVYNKQMEEGEDATWETLSHEAFHQFIFYFYGSLSPHSWYNEGTGDYYGGHEYARKKFVPAPRQIRKDTVKQLLREGRLAPLEEFVRWTQREYYGQNDYQLEGIECYGEGWSFIYFLRSSSKVRGWNPTWDAILPTYLETLLDTGDLDYAVNRAFAGVDWAVLEATWKTFIDKQL